MNDYRMPEEIRREFTREMMSCFLEKLVDIFDYMPSKPTYYDYIVYVESNAGWYEAFKKMCISYGLEDILSYYDHLEWYDSDMFDGELSDLLLEYELIEEGKVDEGNEYE